MVWRKILVVFRLVVCLETSTRAVTVMLFYKDMWCCSVAWSDVTVCGCRLLFSLCRRACDIMARFENNSTGVCDVRAFRSTCVLLGCNIQETSRTGFYHFTLLWITQQSAALHALLSIHHHIAGFSFSSGLQCICIFSLNHSIITKR